MDDAPYPENNASRKADLFHEQYSPTGVAKQVLTMAARAVKSFDTADASLQSIGADPELALLLHVGWALYDEGCIVVLRRGMGCSDMSKAARTLRNTFLVVRHPQGDEDLVVEPQFQRHFSLAQSTPEYHQRQANLPNLFVGGRSALLQLVSGMATAAQASFSDLHSEPPPWRTRAGFLSKWLPQRALDVPLLGRPTPQTEGSVWRSGHSAGSDAGTSACSSKQVSSFSSTSSLDFYDDYVSDEEEASFEKVWIESSLPASSATQVVAADAFARAIDFSSLPMVKSSSPLAVVHGFML